MAFENTKYLRELLRKMNSHFSLEEIKILCYFLTIEFENLPERETKLSATHSLIIHLARLGRLKELVEYLQEERPNVEWPLVPPPQQQMQDEIETRPPTASNTIGQTVIIGGDNQGHIALVNLITQGVSEIKFNRAQSERFNLEGRKSVREFGQKMATEGLWDFWPLGQAMESYFDAIRWDPTHQQPWTNLAYVYHLLGYKARAEECLSESFRLAGPGRNHTKVATAIRNNKFISGGDIKKRRSIPEWFRDQFGKYF